MLTKSDRDFIDRAIERKLMHYPAGMDPKDPSENLMYEYAEDWMIDECWDGIGDLVYEFYPDSENPVELFNKLSLKEQNEKIKAYVSDELDKMTYADLYAYVDDRGFFEVDYDPHEKDEYDA